MAYTSIQNGFSAGEMSPRLFGRTDLAKYQLGCGTLRNFYVDYRGGASSRAGLAYIGMCKQGAPNSGGTATDNPPRDIEFQFNINQGYALEFGDEYMRIKSNGAYVVEDSQSVTSATNADPAVFTSASHGYANGDWLYLSGMNADLNNIIYVASSASNVLTIVNNGVVSTVAVGQAPSAVCISPDGGLAYVTNYDDGTVSVINTASRLVVATISVGTNPDGIAITPSGSEVYVANSGSNNVSVISTVSNAVTHTISVGTSPSGIAIQPDGIRAYVTCQSDDTVIPITTSTHTAGVAIPVGNAPLAVAITPDSAYAYVSNSQSDSVSVVETATNTVLTVISVSTYPIGITVTPDGDFVYVADYNSGLVSVIATASNTVTDTISVDLGPNGIAASADSSKIYVGSNNFSTVSTIDVATNSVTGTVPVASVGAVARGGQAVAVYSAEGVAGGFSTLNGLAWVVANKTTDTYELTDLFGNAVDSSAWEVYTANGLSSRVYTVESPYDAVDLPFLKYVQSADTMTLTCVNQETFTEYPIYNLVRNGATDWVFTAETFGTSITAPTNISVVANSSTTLSTYYSYVVTAVDAETGEESIASSAGTVQNNDISINAGSNTITWNPVAGASSYNVYAATPSYGPPVPVGSSYGYLGTAYGTQFTDTNIVADFTISPPVHKNPFARGAIARVTPTAQGTSYTQANVSYNITTVDGEDAVIVPVVINGGVVAYIIQNAGENYAAGDTITITSSGAGSGGTASLTVGATSGTFPSVCTYYQQRRGYANTLTQPDTYFFSQVGAFNNMDSSQPTTDNDAFTGSPWAQQINGIQFMVPMNPGLIVLTGQGAWLLNGGDVSSFSATTQTAQAQSYNGCSNHIPPLIVNLDILYVQSKGSIIRDLSYNFYQNIFTGSDMTVLSEHLFNFHQVQDWAYAEEPYKIVWLVRDDGAMLSFTYLREQDVYGWARHDTYGLFTGVCSIVEPPVDAVYAIVKRYIAGQGVWAYYSERMNNRNWKTVEDCFCVDSGLSLPVTYPDATLTPSAADGTDNISSLIILSGGSGYVSPSITAIDPSGSGFGFVGTVSVTGGVITGYTISSEGQGYVDGTIIRVTDSEGVGASIDPVITNIVNFSSDSAAFSTAAVGDVIRIGNSNASVSVQYQATPSGTGKAIITSVYSSTNVAANIISPITNTLPDNGEDEVPIPVPPGYWSISTPVDTITGLNHLEGMDVVALADGGVVSNLTVENGSVTLPTPCSSVVVGLSYTAQLQTLYLDLPSSTTTQGKRKNLQAVTVRVEGTRGISVGTNQIDASTQPNEPTPIWTNMYEMKQRNVTVPPGTAIPLYTGDLREMVGGDWKKPGQVAIQQSYPLPANILAVIPEWQIGDTPG